MDECNNIIDRHLKKDKKERKPRKRTEKELFEKENNKKDYSKSIRHLSQQQKFRYLKKTD